LVKWTPGREVCRGVDLSNGADVALAFVDLDMRMPGSDSRAEFRRSPE
jgi:hypothetical protein